MPSQIIDLKPNHESKTLVAGAFAQGAGDPGYPERHRRGHCHRSVLQYHPAFRPQNIIDDICCMGYSEQPCSGFSRFGVS